MGDAVSMETRRQRVAGGSRRKRDLAATGAAPPARRRERWERDANQRAVERAEQESRRREREDRLRPEIRETADATAAFAKVVETLRAALPDSAFRLWVEPLTLVGEVNGALWLDAPDAIAAWTERRYAHLIGEAIREATDYRGFFLGREEQVPDEDEGLL